MLMSFRLVMYLLLFNPVALRKVYNFGLSECNRVNTMHVQEYIGKFWPNRAIQMVSKY